MQQKYISVKWSENYWNIWKFKFQKQLQMNPSSRGNKIQPESRLVSDTPSCSVFDF